jgi:hypothetical protein
LAFFGDRFSGEKIFSLPPPSKKLFWLNFVFKKGAKPPVKGCPSCGIYLKRQQEGILEWISPEIPVLSVVRKDKSNARNAPTAFV